VAALANSIAELVDHITGLNRMIVLDHIPDIRKMIVVLVIGHKWVVWYGL
jgi:hypothetical protein